MNARLLFPRCRLRDRIALDRASARRIDHDGHLHVAGNVLSAAAISPYFGSEIPDFEQLGLKPDRIYQLLRDPAELAKAAASFDGKPLLIKHRPQTADDHDHEIVIGAVSNPTFDAATGRLKGDLSIWDGDAIRAVQDGSNAALSCGYFYRAEMSPGTYQGVRYDGRMVDIKANHVSLVPEGRVAMAMVGDAAIKFKRRLKMAADDNDGSDDTREKLLDYLAKCGLSGKALLGAIRIIDGEDADDDESDGEAAVTAGTASDAARRRQAADARMRASAEDDARRLRMFPHYNRLLSGY